MPLDDSSGRLRADDCAASRVDRDNRDMYCYVMRRQSNGEPCDEGLKPPPACRRAWAGHGVSSCVIDEDSAIRLQTVLTRHGERSQTATRTFHAAPDLTRGALFPDAESRLIHGAEGSVLPRSCPCDSAHVSERDFGRFDPCMLDHPVAVENVVPAWSRGGASSRHLALSCPFQRRLRNLRRSAASAETPGFRAADPVALGATAAEVRPPPPSDSRVFRVLKRAVGTA